MNKELIDQLWNQATRETLQNGELNERYHLSKLVAEHEREACAKVCEEMDARVLVLVPSTRQKDVLAAAIRARGNYA
jgi:hypothetical protein